MHTMNQDYLFLIRRQRITYSKTLNIVRRIIIVISVYLIFGLLFQYVYASTNTTNDPYQAQHGSVWLLPDGNDNNGVYLEALQMHSDVNYTVTGNIARAIVKQRFKNSSALWAEGIYVFPLPENAAVDHFRMVIGERIIEGRIKERVAAKKIYERAKSAGKKASLIEQQRPNVFTTSLANIAPGEEITVEFEFQQTLTYNDGVYRLRFPLVVGPRYHPGQPSLQNLRNPAFDETSVYSETDSKNKMNNPVRIHVLLDAGVNLIDLKSSYHDIDIKQTSETRYSIATIGEHIASDRDFELLWQPQLNDSPQLSAFNEIIDGENYTMITLLPPDLNHLQQKVPARDVVFVLDISGSMAGTSIEQAKAALMTALDGLSAIDRFNIIWFNDKTGRLFAEAVTADAVYKNHAKRFIENLQAGGGTEMLPALKLALSKREPFSRFRQVIFLTDGNISNEAELFDVIDKQLDTSRLFTIGIGSAPNAYFMRRAANKGRGTFTYIGDVNEVKEKTVALFKKLETPALLNIKLNIDRDRYEIFPDILPDLYAGETANILIKGKSLPDALTISGDYGNSEWQTHAILNTTTRSGIRVAWAREKIASLMSRRHESDTGSQRKTLKKNITETALQHHLVSRYTSLVAVDLTPVNAEGMLYRERLKNNLPYGWKKSAATNGIMLAQTATGSRLNLLMAFIFFIAAITLLLRNWQWQK